MDDGLSGRAHASGQGVLREAEPTAKGPKLLVVVEWDCRQGRRTCLLPTESPVVRDHELLGGSAGGKSSGPAKHGPHGQMRFESAGSDGGLHCTDMNAAFLGRLNERQQLSLLRVMCDHRASPYEDWRRHGAQPTVPHAKRVHRHVQKRGDHGIAQCRRELARPVTVFDGCSPTHFSSGRNRRILQDLARPPAFATLLLRRASMSHPP
jgi:hypothetical protein